MNKQPTGLDVKSYLSTLAMNPEQDIARIYQMDGASLYKVADDHYVCVTCNENAHRHKGRPLLERVLPRDWECFASAVNVDEHFEIYHYGPAT